MRLTKHHEQNHSGIRPLGHRVLVLPDDITETDEVLKRAKDAGLEVVADKQMEREQASQCEATVVAIGPSAWADTHDGIPQAQVGDRVLLGKYAGILVLGKDKKMYRLVWDLDLTAELEVA